MDNDLDAFFNSLDGPVAVSGAPHKETAAEISGARPANAHNCFECNGTGRYQGRRVHQEKSQCFACKGRGWFKSSYADRMKNRQKAAARKAKLLDDVKAAFAEQHPGFIEALRGLASWHQFAASLVAQFDERGTLTDKQVAAGQSTIAKQAARNAERTALRSSKSGEVSMAAITAMFDAAIAAGLNKPRFVTEALVLSLAPVHSKNAGAVYVKRRADKEYMGKIANGTFSAAREAPADILDLVRELAANPTEAARKYGRATGACACCGRKLTDAESVAAGIGPICASNWGL